MRKIQANRVLSIVFKIVIAVSALITLLFVISFPVYLPLKGTIFYLLFVIPSVIFILWVLRKVLLGRLKRKQSPFPFYVVVLGCALFLMVAASIPVNLHMKKISAATMIRAGVRASRTFRIVRNKPGLSRWRSNLRADYLRLQLPKIWPLPQRKDSLSLLDFKVESYSVRVFENLFREMFINQKYFFKAETSRPFIIDCGSHIGMSVMYFKTLYPDARILAFEPAPETFRMLKTNVEKNNLKDVVLYDKALSDHEGELMFYGDLSEGSSLFSKGNGKVVDVVRLSQFIDREVDFLKMDIEGAEKQVLDDLVVSDKLAMVQQMNIEYHHHLYKKDEDELSGFLKILEDHDFGYQIFGASGLPYKKGSRNIMKIFAYRK